MTFTHIFDLDKTIWDCSDVYGNSIWAKQLLPPFSINGLVITDDVGSTCRLRNGVHRYMSSLVSSRSLIGYCSVGRVYHLPDQYQPSLLLLDLFNLKFFSPTLCFLGYKTDSKVDHLVNVGDCIFYDDDQKNHIALRDYKSIYLVDSSAIIDWDNFTLTQ